MNKLINDGMRALKLNAEKQATLRNQFHKDPRGLLQHIKALYNAKHPNQNA